MNYKKRYHRPVADIIRTLETQSLMAGSVVTPTGTQEATEEARGGASSLWDTGETLPHKSLFDEVE